MTPLHTSQLRNVFERLLSRIGIKPFRCRRCGQRYWCLSSPAYPPPAR